MFYFPYVGNNHPNCISYFSEGVKLETTNQKHEFKHGVSTEKTMASLEITTPRKGGGSAVHVVLGSPVHVVPGGRLYT